jgi:hypothetical protein
VPRASPLQLVGKVVQLHGLAKRVELNGRRGKAVSYNVSTGRIGVALQQTNAFGGVERVVLALQPSNLLVEGALAKADDKKTDETVGATEKLSKKARKKANKKARQEEGKEPPLTPFLRLLDAEAAGNDVRPSFEALQAPLLELSLSDVKQLIRATVKKDAPSCLMGYLHGLPPPSDKREGTWFWWKIFEANGEREVLNVQIELVDMAAAAKQSRQLIALLRLNTPLTASAVEMMVSTHAMNTVLVPALKAVQQGVKDGIHPLLTPCRCSERARTTEAHERGSTIARVCMCACTSC